METKPGVFEKKIKFKLKSNFEANTENKEVEASGWKVPDRINQVIESTSQEKVDKIYQIKKKLC